MLPLISLIYDTFINVYNQFSLGHVLNVVGCGQLTLQLCLELVVGGWYGLNLILGEAQLSSQVPTEHGLAQV